MPPLSPIQRRNYFIHCVEGGLYSAGLAFVAVDTILPPMIHKLGGAAWLVALAPALLHICFFSPGLIATPIIERLPRLFPYVAWIGVVQRLPYLLAAIILWFGGNSHPGLVLWVVVLTPVISGLAGGLAVPAWMELITRMIPEHRRASGWAWRFVVSTTLGALVGLSIERILAAHPDATGYAILHGGAAGMLFLSLLFFCQLRETEYGEPQPKEHDWYRKQFRIYRQILTTPSPFRSMLLTRVLGAGFMILIPYLSITVLEVSGRPESDLGRFVVVQMIGALSGNFLGGWLGDKLGGKAVLMTAKGVQLLLWCWPSIPVTSGSSSPSSSLAWVGFCCRSARTPWASSSRRNSVGLRIWCCSICPTSPAPCSPASSLGRSTCSRASFCPCVWRRRS